MAVTTNKIPSKALTLFYQAKAINSSLTAQMVASLINDETKKKAIQKALNGEAFYRKEYKERTVYNVMHGLVSDEVVENMLKDIISGKIHLNTEACPIA